VGEWQILQNELNQELTAKSAEIEELTQKKTELEDKEKVTFFTPLTFFFSFSP
jgi:hypothetical protein